MERIKSVKALNSFLCFPLWSNRLHFPFCVRRGLQLFVLGTQIIDFLNKGHERGRLKVQVFLASFFYPLAKGLVSILLNIFLGFLSLGQQQSNPNFQA